MFDLKFVVRLFFVELRTFVQSSVCLFDNFTINADSLQGAMTPRTGPWVLSIPEEGCGWLSFKIEPNQTSRSEDMPSRISGVEMLRNDILEYVEKCLLGFDLKC